jgi:hypothetical protein
LVQLYQKTDPLSIGADRKSSPRNKIRVYLSSLCPALRDGFALDLR